MTGEKKDTRNETGPEKQPPVDVKDGTAGGQGAIDPSLILSKCGRFTDPKSGEEHIIVPVKEFEWIICIPWVAQRTTMTTDKGIVKFIRTRVAERGNDDWADHLEVFKEGKMINPISRLAVIIDRTEHALPMVKVDNNKYIMEMKG